MRALILSFLLIISGCGSTVHHMSNDFYIDKKNSNLVIVSDEYTYTFKLKKRDLDVLKLHEEFDYSFGQITYHSNLTGEVWDHTWMIDAFPPKRDSTHCSDKRPIADIYTDSGLIKAQKLLELGFHLGCGSFNYKISLSGDREKGIPKLPMENLEFITKNDNVYFVPWTQGVKNENWKQEVQSKYSN